MPPDHDPVVVDGKESSPAEWAGSIPISCQAKGEAAVLWDRAGVYVHFSAESDPSAPPMQVFFGLSDASQESLPVCLLIEVGPTVAVLRNLVAMRNGLKDEWIYPPFDDTLVRFAAAPRVAFWMGLTPVPFVASHRSPEWSAELFVAWDLLGVGNAPSHCPRALVLWGGGHSGRSRRHPSLRARRSG
jgi:hypothetical protein